MKLIIKPFIKFTILSLLWQLLFPSNLQAQHLPEVAAMNRVIFSRQDTVYEFHTIKPEKKIRLKNENFYYWYVSDTILLTRGGRDGKLLHKQYKVTYPNKNLKEEGLFLWGLKTGIWKTWHPNGELKTIENWKRGRRNGTASKYSSTGKLLWQGAYKDDLLSGWITEYLPDSSIRKKEYKQGELLQEINEKKEDGSKEQKKGG
jgi:hypothetical protein